MLLAVIIIPLSLLSAVISPINSSSLSEWSSWSDCTRSCSGGVRYRKLRTRYDLRIDLQSCNSVPCFYGQSLSQHQNDKLDSPVDQVVSQLDFNTLVKQFLASKTGQKSTIEFEVKKLKIQNKLFSNSKQTNIKKLQPIASMSSASKTVQHQDGIVLTKYKPPKPEMGLKIRPKFISKIYSKSPKAEVESKVRKIKHKVPGKPYQSKVHKKIFRNTKHENFSKLPKVKDSFNKKIVMKSNSKIRGRPWRSKMQKTILQNLKGEIYGEVSAPKSTLMPTSKPTNFRKNIPQKIKGNIHGKVSSSKSTAMPDLKINNSKKQLDYTSSKINLAKVRMAKIPTVKTNRENSRLSLKGENEKYEKQNMKEILHTKLKPLPGQSNSVQTNGVGAKYSIESALTEVEFQQVHIYDIDTSNSRVKRAISDKVERTQIDAVLTSSDHLLVVGAFGISIGVLLLVWALRTWYRRRCTNQDNFNDHSIA